MTAAAPARARWKRLTAFAVLVVVVLLAGYLSTVGVLRSRTLVLPMPTGAHQVGRAIITADNIAPGTEEPGRAAWVWYPADPRSSDAAPEGEYVPDGWRGSLPPTFGLGWFLQDVGSVRSWSHHGATPAGGRWPVVMMLPGFENAPWMYTSIGEELASHGHVVALLVPPTTPARVVGSQARTAIESDQPPPPAEVDRLIGEQSADLIALLGALGTASERMFGAHLDTDNAVFAGHSLGGGAAVAACELEPRCAGSINLDGPQPDLPGGAPAKPELLLGADSSCAVVTPCSAAGATPDFVQWIQQRREAVPPQRSATITGAGHNGFGDPVSYFVAIPFSDMAGTGSIPAPRMHAVLRSVMTTSVAQLRTGKPINLSSSAETPELVPR
ncbi:alpha/beta hydrolase [Nocardia thraciensis]